MLIIYGVLKIKCTLFVDCRFSISGDQVLVAGLYGDSPNCTAREWAYRVFLYPDQQQESLLKELLSARQELAIKCGFPSYAHR